MRSLSRSMPLFLTLGLALAGCNQAGDQSTSAPVPQASGEYVLTVEGMV
jgi:nitrous oxide reductase accessory protein NosL